MTKKKTFWGQLFAALFSILKSIFTLEVLLDIAKTRLIKFAIKKLVLVSSWQVYLIELLAEELFERVLVPAAQYAVREGKLAIDIKDGEATIQAINQANEANNEDDFNSAIDDI